MHFSRKSEACQSKTETLRDENVFLELKVKTNSFYLFQIYILFIVICQTCIVPKYSVSIFARQRLPFYKALGVAACTVRKVRASTMFMCVCCTFRSSDFLLFVKNGFVVGVRSLKVTACHSNNAAPAMNTPIVSVPRIG